MLNGDGQILEKPSWTKIRRDVKGDGSVVWVIPARGRFGFFLYFGVCWILVTAMVSGGFLFSFSSGGRIKGNFPEWVFVPFFAMFWVIGLFFLYAGLREKYMSHVVSVGGGIVRLRREMFGKVREKVLQEKGVTSVAEKVFYQRNYQPVYGIEIRGIEGKLRFGSNLEGEEKAWLVADIDGVLKSRKKGEVVRGGGAMLEPMKVGKR